MSAPAKLAKLAALLGSDKEGEVLATVGAMKRVLGDAGRDFNDLAAMLGAALPPAPKDASPYVVDAPPAWRDLSLNEKRAWLAALSALDWLTPRECEIVGDTKTLYFTAPHHASVSWQKRRLIERLIARAAGLGMRP